MGTIRKKIAHRSHELLTGPRPSRNQTIRQQASEMATLERLMNMFNSSANVDEMAESLKHLKEKLPEQLTTLEWTMASVLVDL